MTEQHDPAAGSGLTRSNELKDFLVNPAEFNSLALVDRGFVDSYVDFLLEIGEEIVMAVFDSNCTTAQIALHLTDFASRLATRPAELQRFQINVELELLTLFKTH